MRERRALRFVIEALFLGLLAAALVVADQDPLVIGGVMLLGWLVVALYEWAATRELPHYGRGLPPRYYVPQVSLPPPRRLEQLPSQRRSGYPAPALDDQATWIATPAMRAKALAEWPLDPVAGSLPAPTPGEDTMVVDDLLVIATGEEFHEDTWIELDPIAEGYGWDPGPVAVVAVEEAVDEPAPAPVEEPEPVVEPEPEPEPVAAAEPEVPEALVEPEPTPEVVVEEPEVVVVDEAEPEPQRAPVAEVALAEPEPPVVVPEPEPEEEPEPDRLDDLALVAAASVIAAPDVEAVDVPDPEPSHDLAPAVVGAVVAEPDELVEPEVEDDTEEDVTPPVAEESPVPVPERPARHTFDPFAAETPARRRWRRRDDPYVELPARPPAPIALPGASRREES